MCCRQLRLDISKFPSSFLVIEGRKFKILIKRKLDGNFGISKRNFLRKVNESKETKNETSSLCGF